MAIITTPGSATANSYIDIAGADLYFTEERYHSEDWFDADAATKEQVLRWATRLLDLEHYVGLRADPLGVDQNLDWPRSFVPHPDTGEFIDSTTIPKFMEDATAEYALFLYREDRTGAAQEATAGFNKIKVDVIELGIETKPGAQKDVMPDSVRALIADYLAGGSDAFVKKIART